MSYATIFGIVLLPLVTTVGVSIDYTTAATQRSILQAKADDMALHQQGGVLIDKTTYRVSLTDNLPTTFLGLIGVNTINVAVTADANVIPGVEKFKPPRTAQLDPEAGDYNKIDLYCYNPATTARTDYVTIADNGGTIYSPVINDCPRGAVRHQRLTNVRDARTNKALWQSGGSRFVYYTDNLKENILETVLCQNMNECQNKPKGVLTVGKNRNPNIELVKCSPSKFMYYGYEDRPTGGDRDYDDIRIIIECPVVEITYNKTTYLKR